MIDVIPFRRIFLSDAVLRVAEVPDHLLEPLGRLPPVLSEEADHELVVMLASEVLGRQILPDWAGSQTRYLILADIPEPALMRIPSILAVHKPDQRIHVTRDVRSLTRLLIALHREDVWEGIVDAYTLDHCLIVVLGDMSMREFPQEKLPRVSALDAEAFSDFEIDESGSYLYWATVDAHIGASQMLQAVDPMYLADIEIERYALQKLSLALLDMREDRALRQSDISDLSERHVRRLEKEEVRLTLEAAEKYARAFGQTLSDFLDELSRRIGALAEPHARGDLETVPDTAASDAGSRAHGEAKPRGGRSGHQASRHAASR